MYIEIHTKLLSIKIQPDRNWLIVQLIKINCYTDLCIYVISLADNYI